MPMAAVTHSLTTDSEVRTLSGDVVKLSAGMLILSHKEDGYDALLPTGETVHGLDATDIDRLKTDGVLA